MAPSTLLPHLAGLRLEQVRLDGGAVLLHLTRTACSARCPVCSRWSRRVQSVYHRTVSDLPICGRRLLLRLRVRRLRCDARCCPRAIFAERFPHLVGVRGRRTPGQRAALEAIVCALEEDRAAVAAALTLEWSNGQTERRLNKLKLLKRSMDGRANFDLLRRRVLRAA